jgi:2-haloacid dehalogenase
MTGTADLTLDVFSALIDSRAGASPVLDRIATWQSWYIDRQGLRLGRDRAHKVLPLECASWVSFASLGRQAMARALKERHVDGGMDALMAER